MAPALFAYFLQPPSATGVFPYLQPAPFDTTYMGQTIKEVTFGGIFACLPVLWVLPFAKRVLQLRMSQRSTRTIAGVIVVLLLGGVIVALADAEMAGILQRYFADFSFMFLAAVVLLVFIVNENLQPGSTVQNLLMKVLLVLVAVSVLYSALLCFVPETAGTPTCIRGRTATSSKPRSSGHRSVSVSVSASVRSERREVHGIHHRREHRGYEPSRRRRIASFVEADPSCVLGLATGTTPIGLYACLVDDCAQGKISFADVTTFNLDEYRGLDPEHDQSYRYFMKKHLFDHVDIDQARTHVPEGSNPDAEAVCAAYEQAIEEAGGIDLQLLGLGPNGHIGFNEPEDTFPRPRTAWISPRAPSRRTAACSTALKTCRARRTPWASAPSWPRAACSWWWRVPTRPRS